MDPFVGEIRLYPYTFAPKDWQRCDGTELFVQDHYALFRVVGNTYGGREGYTFRVPDMTGRVPVQANPGTHWALGSHGGSDTVTLHEDEMAFHTHPLMADASDPADTTAVSPAASFAISQGASIYSSTENAELHALAVGNAGGNQPHPNLMPYLTLDYFISLKGVFPNPPGDDAD